MLKLPTCPVGSGAQLPEPTSFLRAPEAPCTIQRLCPKRAEAALPHPSRPGGLRWLGAAPAAFESAGSKGVAIEWCSSLDQTSPECYSVHDAAAPPDVLRRPCWPCCAACPMDLVAREPPAAAETGVVVLAARAREHPLYAPASCRQRCYAVLSLPSLSFSRALCISPIQPRSKRVRSSRHRHGASAFSGRGNATMIQITRDEYDGFIEVAHKYGVCCPPDQSPRPISGAY
ncbi:hypothetical protein ACCO45_002335 [Purpureocillium lilacinum]|uniref:Uncharacterized protein n=1 Tax=Purpureocillium lilacinum TaxID=33203 RepID=A0ACC4EA48_PURLI